MNQVAIMLLVAGTFVASVKTEPCPDTAQLSCGGKTYNPLSEMCCQEIVGSIANMTHPDCCGKQVYERSTHLCCSHNGQEGTTDVSKMTRSECCGTKAYDVTLSKCCSADVEGSMPIVYQPSIKSCRHAAQVGDLSKTILYDMSSGECGCGVSYKTKTQKCCPGNVVLNIPANMTRPDCCGKEIYDQNTHKCCAGKLHDISGTVQPSCCGQSGDFYDQASELCCDGAIKYFHGLGSPACCGKEAFDSESRECKSGKISVKKEAPVPKTFFECTEMSVTRGFKCPKSHPIMNSVNFPQANFVTMDVKCCVPRNEGINKANYNTQEPSGANKTHASCHGSQFITGVCVDDCSPLDFAIDCCRFDWSSSRAPVGVGKCRDAFPSADGSLSCTDDEVLKKMCFDRSRSCPKGNTWSATCCKWDEDPYRS